MKHVTGLLRIPHSMKLQVVWVVNQLPWAQAQKDILPRSVRATPEGVILSGLRLAYDLKSTFITRPFDTVREVQHRFEQSTIRLAGCGLKRSNQNRANSFSWIDPLKMCTVPTLTLISEHFSLIPQNEWRPAEYTRALYQPMRTKSKTNHICSRTHFSALIADYL